MFHTVFTARGLEPVSVDGQAFGYVCDCCFIGRGMSARRRRRDRARMGAVEMLVRTGGAGLVAIFASSVLGKQLPVPGVVPAIGILLLSVSLVGLAAMLGSRLFAIRSAGKGSPAARNSPFSETEDIPLYRMKDRSESAPSEHRWSLSLLRSLDWKVFEDLCAEFARASGFRAATTPLGADGGVDIWLYKAEKPKPVAAVQCKAWKSWNVGVKPVRELYGVMAAEGVENGFFITSGTFTEEARKFEGDKRIELIDGETLLERIRLLAPDVQDGLLREVTRGGFFYSFLSEVWPEIGAANVGDGVFWGCRSFPRCRGKLNGGKTWGSGLEDYDYVAHHGANEGTEGGEGLSRRQREGAFQNTESTEGLGPGWDHRFGTEALAFDDATSAKRRC